MNISYFTISNIIKKHNLINIDYKLKNCKVEKIKCTTNGKFIPRKFRTCYNINSNRIRDLGLLDVFDLNNKIWRTLVILCITKIECDGIVYKFKG